jgi:uncharacterized membrane protein required for colicin V production
MPSTESWTLGLAVVDVVVIAACLLGVLAGALAGLGRAFALLLWLLVALFLGHHLSGRVASWLPNSVEPGDRQAVLVTYVVLAGIVMTVPVLNRLFGGMSGKKKKDGAPRTHKPFGALVGLLVAVLTVTALLPFLGHVPALDGGFREGHSPAWAADFADNMTYLYPPAHRETLRTTLASDAGAAAPAAPSR